MYIERVNLCFEMFVFTLMWWINRQTWVINRKGETQYREESLCNISGSVTAVEAAAHDAECCVWMVGDAIYKNC